MPGMFDNDPLAAELQRQFGLQPNMDRLSILPRYSKKDGWVAPSMLYDAAKAFVAPKVAMDGNFLPPEEAVNTALNVMGSGSVASKPVGALGMNVWHGSPHKFDKFDINKLGSGEGAQAYGHGMYFAENPAVAQQYQKELSQRYGFKFELDGGVSIDPKKFPAGSVEGTAWNRVYDKLRYSTDKDKNFNNVIKDVILEARVKKNGANDPEYLKREAEIASYLEKSWSGRNKVVEHEGALYKVDIPDPVINKFLNWDTKIADQSHVLKAIDKINKKYGLDYDGSYTGADLYRGLTVDMIRTGKAKTNKEAQKLVSEMLDKAGVKGVKYLDQQSRTAKEGSSNFVVFDPNHAKILERNNKPLKEKIITPDYKDPFGDTTK